MRERREHIVQRTDSLVYDLEKLFMEMVRAILTPDLFNDKKKALILQKYGYLSTAKNESEIVFINGKEFEKRYCCLRAVRNKPLLLEKLGSKRKNVKPPLEVTSLRSSKLIDYVYDEQLQDHPYKDEEGIRPATIFPYKILNPKGRVLEINLNGKNGEKKSFYITPNYACFNDNHHIIFPVNDGNSALKQVYQEDLLYFMDTLAQIGDANYRCFFNSEGAGHSMRTFHIQVLKARFRVFENLDRYYEDNDFEADPVINTCSDAWPFTGFLCRYRKETMKTILPALEAKIDEWLSKDTINNTFNLLFQIREDGYREFFFAPRIKNEISLKFTLDGKEENVVMAGFEIAGTIILDSLNIFNNFPQIIEGVTL
jgi:hypothetical protein